MSKVRHIGKYKFEDKETFLDKKEALGVDEEGNPTHPHLLVELGYEVLTPATETTEAVYSTSYLVDVLWVGLQGDAITEEVEGETIITGYEPADHPYGWKTRSVDIADEGIHSFLGLKYQDFKI